MKVQIPKPNYSSKDVIEGTVNANYYFGSPVSKGTVTVKIFKQYYWRPWWYFTEYSWFYKSYERPGIINWREMELLNTLEGTLDEKGEYKFTYEVKENSDADYTYIFTADVVDASTKNYFRYRPLLWLPVEALHYLPVPIGTLLNRVNPS